MKKLPSHCAALVLMLLGLGRSHGDGQTSGLLRASNCTNVRQWQALATGVIQGDTISLGDPVPSLDGGRVRLTIELADEVILLNPAEHREARQSWVERGPSQIAFLGASRCLRLETSRAE